MIKFGTNDLNIGKEGETSSIHEDKDSSYEYKGKEIVVIGRKGNFEVRSIVVFRTKEKE